MRVLALIVDPEKTAVLLTELKNKWKGQRQNNTTPQLPNWKWNENEIKSIIIIIPQCFISTKVIDTITLYSRCKLSKYCIFVA